LVVERQEPIVTQWEQQGDALTVHFAYPHDALYFQGHFPNAPILPGVAQLFTVRNCIQQAFKVRVDGAIKRLKFQQPILPTQEVTLTVKRKSATAFEFALQTAAGPCASGILSVREAEM
jgi:3-hydroxymyristoyl/3-hydroxydecanoyl-(acyl carrier protein) dehydratase